MSTFSANAFDADTVYAALVAYMRYIGEMEGISYLRDYWMNTLPIEQAQVLRLAEEES